MGMLRGLKGLFSSIWTFVSMVVMPIIVLGVLEQGVEIGGTVSKIKMVSLNIGLLVLLGLIAMILVAVAHSVHKKWEGLIIFFKYLVAIAFEYIWVTGISHIVVETTVEGRVVVTYVSVDIMNWFILLAVSSLLLGILKAITQYYRFKDKAV